MFSATFDTIHPTGVLETEKNIFIPGPNLVISKKDGTKSVFLEGNPTLEMCKYTTGSKEYMIGHNNKKVYIFDNKGNIVDTFDHPKKRVDKIKMCGDSIMYLVNGIVYRCDIDGNNIERVYDFVDFEDYNDIYRGDYRENTKTYELQDYTLTVRESLGISGCRCTIIKKS